MTAVTTQPGFATRRRAQPKPPRTFAGALLVATLVGSSAVHAADLSGTVRNDAGSPLAQMEVTLWRDLGAKRFEIVYATQTNGSGGYAFSGIEAGDYRVHARMAPGVVGNYGDRWYDVAEPTAGGYVGAAADVLTLGAADSLAGVDFTLQVLGGLDGSVALSGGGLLSNVLVRVEQTGDTRIHHNDTTQTGPHLGNFYARGLPPGPYRVLAHDPLGNLETRIAFGPFNVQSNAVGSAGTIPMFGRGADPYEPNNAPGEAGTRSVDGAALHADPPVTWRSAGAYLAPRGSDIDWHCFDTAVEDRLLFTVTTTLDPTGIARENPWVDPVLGIFSGDGATLLWMDDDSGPGARESFVDTGPITGAGTICAVVTTFGDVDFNAGGQQSAGSYTLEVAMGNRRPWLDVTWGGNPAPRPPARVFVAESESLTIIATYGDPDDDDLTVDMSYLDALAADRSGEATFAVISGSATFTWTAGERDATGNPYALSLAVSDDEFTRSVDLVIEVESVNRAPSTPVQLQPADAAAIRSSTVDLVVGNSTDIDGDPLSYEYELYYGSQQAAPDQVGLVDEDPSGQTSYTTEDIPDDTAVRWRVRAWDGQEENAYSAWTDFRTFLVDSSNGPPSAPVLMKPENGEVVPVRWPALSVQNSDDAEGDALTIHFQVATDAGFEEIVADSGPVPQLSLGSTTSWSVPEPLEWGGTYWARAWAEDALGAVSDMSNVNRFSIKENEGAGEPGLGDPLASQCQGYIYADGPPESFVVGNVTDPEGDPISFELEILAFSAAEGDEPVLAVTVPQDDEAAFTVIPIDGTALERGRHYRIRVRATDGEHASEWSECDFYIGEAPPPTVELRILTPENGTVFTRDTRVVEFVVQNGFDPTVPPQPGLRVAYCASQNPELTDCPLEPVRWGSVPQSSASVSDTTRFQIVGLSRGQTWYVQACSLRPDGQCGPRDARSFSIGNEQTLVSPTCGCGAAEGGASEGLVGLALGALVLAGRRRGGRVRR